MTPFVTRSAAPFPKDGITAFIDQIDWAGTPLGEKALWPKSLSFTTSLLLNAATPMFLLWGAELTCIHNESASLLFEARDKPQKALGQPGRQVLAGIWDSAEPSINAIIEGQSVSFTQEQAFLVERNDQKELTWWTLHYSAVKDDEGRVQGVLVIGQEARQNTEKQKANETLQDQLELTLEACDLGTWDLDPTTKRFTCNEKTKEIFGLESMETVDLKTAVDVIEPDDRPAIEEAIARALDARSGGRYDVEYTVIHPNTGERRVVKAQGKAYFDAQSVPLKFIGTIQDITVEKAGSERREKLLQLVENSADFMAMATLEGAMTYLNLAGRKLVGLEEDADISKLVVKDFYTDEQFAFINQQVVPALKEAGEWTGPITIRHQQTGEEIPCFGSYRLIKDPVSGQPISRSVTFRDLRPDLKARKELEESEMRFRNLVQQAPVATAIYLGKDMRIQWANEAMIKLWGKDKGVVGKTLREALPEIEGQPFHSQLDRVFSTGEMYFATEDKGELVVDGVLQTFYFNFSYKPLRDANGDIYGILNMAIDVTEQVANKRRLQESENAFRHLVMKAPVGICLLKGNDFVVEIANEQYVSLVGRKPEELINRPIWEVLPEAKAQGFDVLLEGVRQSGKPYYGNEQAVELVRNGSLETVYLNFVYEPLFDENQTVYSILVIAIDISQQVKLRQQIENAEERARLAVESGNFGTYEVNLRDGKVIASSRFRELFDIDGEENQYEYVSRIHPDDLTNRQQGHQQALTSGLLQYECRVCRLDGSQNWVRIHGQYHYTTEGTPNKIIGIVQDITRQKNSEEELERRVRERTAALQRLNDELQQFVFISSHDLKEPLRKIQVFGSLAMEQSDAGNEKLQVSLDKVVRSASRMSSLLNDLIQYSTLSDSRQPASPVNLNDTLQVVVEELELLIQEKGAVIKSAALPTVEGISFQLSRLVYNLVHNALKYSKPEVPLQLNIRTSLLSAAELEAQELPPNSRFHKIEFSDNGIGFKPEYAEQIFIVFQQLQNKHTHSGNGMGLAICKKIVTNHHGKIYAASEEGKGSAFTVILPEKAPAH